MSLTATIWLLLFVVFAVLSFRRSSWGIPLYMLTFYAQPPMWWWGKGMLTSAGIRWNLIAALILAVAAFVDSRPKLKAAGDRHRRAWWLLSIFAINATVVHIFFAANPERSYEALVLLWKHIGLALAIWLTVKDEFDFRVFVNTILTGSLYIGYEVVVNDRGNITGSRLEGIGIAGVGDSNYLAGLLSFAIPLAGHMLLVGRKVEKAFALVVLVLVFEVILRCNSRGAFLGLLVAGVWLLIQAKGKVRRHAIAGIALGLLAAFFMIGDEDITNRFMTTFASEEDRDGSAQSRMDYWAQASKMIAAHPIGSGGEAAFKSDLGVRYLLPIGVDHQRAVHNGYLDIAASWGLQGLLLYGIAIFVAWRALSAAARQRRLENDVNRAFLSASIDAVLLGQLVCSLFLSSLDGEWFFWWITMALAYHHLYGKRSIDSQDRFVDASYVDDSHRHDQHLEAALH